MLFAFEYVIILNNYRRKGYMVKYHCHLVLMLVFRCNMIVSYYIYIPSFLFCFQPDRVTADRLILLFFFCSDILLRSLRQNNEIFCYLMEWSKQYLNGLSPACILVGSFGICILTLHLSVICYLR